MDLSKINARNWRLFEKEHPAAYNYLLRASLKGEFQSLLLEQFIAIRNEEEPRLNEWQEKRLAELRELYRGRALMSNMARKLDK